MAREPMGVSVVIPTFGREEVLIRTLEQVLGLPGPLLEVIVVDQTPTHLPETAAALQAWEVEGRLRWLHLPRPSIPVAMNEGLKVARGDVVLFLDDDVDPGPDLIVSHTACYADRSIGAVVGMVLQPGEVPVAPPDTPSLARGLRRDLDFRFNGTGRTDVYSVIACNLSVSREAASSVGGFDEGFVRAAYRFETEFCRRMWRAGRRVVFEPAASLRHLKAASGGTRSAGSHLTSAKPDHAVGDYYFAFLEAKGWERWSYILRRPVREVATRFHALHPWWIPVKLLGEARGLLLALELHRRRSARA